MYYLSEKQCPNLKEGGGDVNDGSEYWNRCAAHLESSGSLLLLTRQQQIASGKKQNLKCTKTAREEECSLLIN